MTFEDLIEAVPTSSFNRYIAGSNCFCFFCGIYTEIKPFLWDRELTDLLVTYCGKCNPARMKLVELSEKDLFTLRVI